MAFNPNASQLSEEQIIQQVFDPDNNALRTELETAVTVTGEVTVEISAASGDNIAISSADGSQTATLTTVGSHTGLDVNLDGLAHFQSNQITVGTSAVRLDSSPLSTRSSISVKSIVSMGNAIYVGNSSSVTTSTGYPLFNNDSIQMDLVASQGIWAIATASGQTACLLELG